MAWSKDNSVAAKLAAAEALLQAQRAEDGADYIDGKKPLIDEFTGEQTNLQTQLDDLVLQSGTDIAEVVQARGGFPTVNARLTDTTAQLADITSNVKSFGAKGDGITDDTLAIQNALDSAGINGTILFPKTPTNRWLISSALKYQAGQRLIGVGGVGVTTNSTQIKLISASTSVIEPKTPSTLTNGFYAEGIYFNAQGFADCAISLYNNSYAKLFKCAANSVKDGSCAILMDSNVSLFCYFNVIEQCRTYASGVGGAGIRFTRGANANQVIGGRCGGSTRGMEFLSLSSGNLILGTDFEENSECHVYVDAANNVFDSTHMESAPLGFNITANGELTRRMNTTFATTTIINVKDVSKLGGILDIKSETAGTTGELKFNAASFTSKYLSGTSSLDIDSSLISGSASSTIRLFLNTNTTGTKNVTIHKGDGTSDSLINFNAGTGAFVLSELQMPNESLSYRKIVRRNALPTTGSWNVGDIILLGIPTLGKGVGAICTVAGTPGTWTSFGAIDLQSSLVWNPASLANGAGETSPDITITGAVLGDYVLVSCGVDLQGMTLTGYVSAANTVKLRLHNGTGATVDFINANFKIKIIKA